MLSPEGLFFSSKCTQNRLSDLRKIVPFGGLDGEYSQLGVQSQPNFHFGDLNRHFKPNMQKNSNSYIFRSVYQIDMQFDRQLRSATGTSWVVLYGGKTFPRWRTAAILKIVISPYLSEKSKKNEKVALNRLRVRQNVFPVIDKFNLKHT